MTLFVNAVYTHNDVEVVGSQSGSLALSLSSSSSNNCSIKLAYGVCFAVTLNVNCLDALL